VLLDRPRSSAARQDVAAGLAGLCKSDRLIGLLIAAFAAGALAAPRCDPPDRAGLIADAGLLPLDSSPEAPPFELPDLTGRAVSLQSLRGRPVLINFWASWCRPCREEAPSLQSLVDGLAAGDFAVVAVNVQEDPAAVAEYLRASGLRLPVALDTDGDVSFRYAVKGFPTTYLVGREGRIVAFQLGGVDFASAAFRALVDSVLSTR
jgi:thiol-disulfide isomerase/thioredoxin